MMKKLNRKKKLLIAATASVLVIALGIGIFAVSRGGGEPVGVYPFEYIGMTEFWGDSQESYGPVTTDKIQTVFLSDTQTVTEILVKEGDEVKKGDKLMTFDTTLDGLALERQRLAVEKVRLQLEDAQAQLEKTWDIVPWDTPGDPYAEPTEPDLGAELTRAYQISQNVKFDGSSEEKALICWMKDTSDISDTLLDTLWQRAVEYQNRNSAKPVSHASALPETTGATEPVQLVLTTEETTVPTEETTVPTEETTVPIEETTVPTEETTVPTEETTVPTEETTVPTEETTIPTEETTEPTQPSVMVSDFYVVIKVTEDNMALGSRLTWQGMRVYRSAQGGYSFRFFDAWAVEDHMLPKEEEETIPPDIDYGPSYTIEDLARMRAELRKQIKELEFDLKMETAEYKIMERELSDGNIYAEVDGKVVSLLTEDEAKASRQPVIKVSGGGGFYIEGSVSELEKDNLKPGQEVTVNDWNTGMTYTGEVKEIGDFPSGDDSWNGMGNPNATYYPFQVFVDESADLQSGRYVSVTYSTSAEAHGIYLQNPFVRTEQGRSYVFVLGEKGRLEQRYVTVGKSLWGSYTEILGGVTEEDLIAFPYGKDVRDGAPAEEKDISSLYEY